MDLERQLHGEVRIDFRLFPLGPAGDEHFVAALTALCVARQGDVWEFLRRWSERSDGPPELLDLAADQGLHADALRVCLEDPGSRAQLEFEMSAGFEAGVFATPFTFVNGQLVRGRRPELLRAAVDRELSK
ncbi:MAG: thioredoxin domain-containing protein [Thermoanaerobaculia bacterium]